MADLTGRRARMVLSTAGLSTSALVAALGGASWYIAGRLTELPADLPIPDARPEDRVRVVGREPGGILLAGAGADRRGVWGVATADGYGRVGAVTGVRGEVVRRRYHHVAGTVRPGRPAVLDPFAHPHDPASIGRPWRDVAVASEVGDLPAWWYHEGDAARWAVLVHGRMARRHETLRLAAVLQDLGHPVLVVTYRGDRDAPRPPDGRGHLGGTEWHDVDRAVGFVLDHGAADVVVGGFSMGGGIALTVAQRSGHADRIAGLVLDAPVLDWGPVVRQAARERRIPGPLAAVVGPAAMSLARSRAGIDWASLNHLRDPSRVPVPTLLLHGTADPVVPVGLADTFAALAPDRVRYVRVEGAGHVRAWNDDPARYAAAVSAFLRDLAAPAGRSRVSPR